MSVTKGTDGFATGLAVAAGCVALAAGIAGCSSQKSDEKSSSTPPHTPTSTTEPGHTEAPVTPAQPDQAKVTFGSNDAGPITAIGCKTDNSETTITIEGSQPTTIVLTDGDTPVVNSVSIGKVGSDGPALLYSEGVSDAPAQVTHDGKHYTVKGTGMGADATNPDAPTNMPFDIAVTCP